ncbi:MAG: bifunctional 4-hydroxy-2-oxoglutarate aldolase/2-dehydro-3-deoxy-phosphogluconate aldolase [Gammaproteobacteria bacterium]|uniref:bifunctional 4-hydroxy-2-oxoglutarate aldolase/2-dehydro-3-deoxy-phosphogluconate aldolase n=1 Tax=Pseudomaricurvus alcaniphilus TaxID=1166482 RepID=UPI0014072356|nr:bifunctional 4-hydroxy-2-oxoglutarate aldolase/2-dehydro-3-deoxy-phosphogluconate aldolase [Pseudomaricurvus alcaniphilus]MBR9912249.1 bifunctional 4-hydroxy-2-oxoglutarate aldolase/2-dehydro-3-deoxy-phosphogluconate aldolase [Gammaproteobacteria bacterium]NHN37374.1 bifunctional 4-hydroxy-2-oxoglutarate aldolase/2-dehydro-3-deoxy-phosphogluconate aldolase [Pseudomaricurvus alcaniphilus]
MSRTSREILKLAPVVPVITIRDIKDAVPLAKALVAGGIPVLEVTLRTPQGLEAIRLMKQEVEGAVVGAGTIVNERDLDNAVEAGSEFIITPGLTDNLLRAGMKCGVTFLPGIATISDLMRCMEHGLDTLKFFPAEAAGGAKTLKAFSGPFPDIRFCPTGGIGLNNIADYLAVSSVLSVGGSWLTPDNLINAGDWAGITRLAKEATEKVASIRSAT